MLLDHGLVGSQIFFQRIVIRYFFLFYYHYPKFYDILETISLLMKLTNKNDYFTFFTQSLIFFLIFFLLLFSHIFSKEFKKNVKKTVSFKLDNVESRTDAGHTYINKVKKGCLMNFCSSQPPL